MHRPMLLRRRSSQAICWRAGTDRTGIVNDAYRDLKTNLAPFASGAYADPSGNPALRGWLDTINGDVMQRVNSQFAAAGRDLSGMNQQALARGDRTGRGAGACRSVQHRCQQPPERHQFAVQRRLERRQQSGGPRPGRSRQPATGRQHRRRAARPSRTRAPTGCLPRRRRAARHPAAEHRCARAGHRADRTARLANERGR